MLENLGIVLVKIVCVGAGLQLVRKAFERLGRHYSKRQAKQARDHLHRKRVLQNPRSR